MKKLQKIDRDRRLLNLERSREHKEKKIREKLMELKGEKKRSLKKCCECVSLKESIGKTYICGEDGIKVKINSCCRRT